VQAEMREASAKLDVRVLGAVRQSSIQTGAPCKCTGGEEEKRCYDCRRARGVYPNLFRKDTCHVATSPSPFPFFSPLPHHDGYRTVVKNKRWHARTVLTLPVTAYRLSSTRLEPYCGRLGRSFGGSGRGRSIELNSISPPQTQTHWPCTNLHAHALNLGKHGGHERTRDLVPNPL